MSDAFGPSSPGAAQPTAPPAFFGTEPGYIWWLVAPGEVVGVRIDQTGRVMALAHGTIGRFTAGDRPFGGRSGYDTWHPLPGSPRQEGAWGYWVTHVPADPAATGGEQR